jgi:hypothetical protein
VATWTFNELRPGDKTREPTQGEFFATDAIRNLAEALVRESIQNSLDAAEHNGTGTSAATVRVRIFLGSGTASRSPEHISEFLHGCWPHLQANGNGLRRPPSPNEQCSFLVIEDFGTSGLIGDVKQWHDISGVKNAFFYFFRAEGRTGKGEEDRGRWGVGKYVFPRSSRANSFFGFTVRNTDGKRLLMGQAVLKTHCCDGTYFKPDGIFGQLDGQLPLPLDDKKLIDRFRSAFSISRDLEPGLSIVIPWIDPEITKETLLDAVIRGYFFPILEGKLVVTVEADDEVLEINESTLVAVTDKLAGASANELRPFVRLAEWAAFRPDQEIIKLGLPPRDRPTWSAPDIIPPATIAILQRKLDAGERIAIRVPILVRTQRGGEEQSFFDVFLVNEGGKDDRTVFIREGIIISDVRARRARGVRSIATIEHKPLATLLGDSENPAHTQWQKDSSNFRDKYPKTYGVAVLSYVTHSVSGIMELVSAQQREEDVTLLKDFFSLPSQDGSPIRQKRRKKKDGTEPSGPPEPPEPRKKRYRLGKVSGGFHISAGEPDSELPQILEIHAAYDVRRGNAFNKYDTADFRMERLPIRLEPLPRGLNIISRKGNQIIAEVQSNDFLLTVVGFDTDRDLCVDVKVKEKSDATDI